jgi:hypothetical protein
MNVFPHQPPPSTIKTCQKLSPTEGLQTSGTFKDHALNAIEHGFAVLPCGGEDGKRPLIRWGGISKPQTALQIKKLASLPSVQSANLGIITGPSGITVVDCDTPGRRCKIEAHFGPTSIVVATPRGGLHLYYKSAGERCGPFELGDMKGDIKGIGGFVVAPPSRRQMDSGKVQSYRFLEGGWAWKEALHPIKINALPLHMYGSISAESDNVLSIGIGERNRTLFRVLRTVASEVNCAEELLARAMIVNADFHAPLDEREVRRTVRSVWDYKIKGTLIEPERAMIRVPRTVQINLRGTIGGPDALMLLMDLIANHAARDKRGEEFWIIAEAMANEESIAGWGVKRYRHATNLLLNIGALKKTHTGGKRKGDSHRYRFGPALSK